MKLFLVLAALALIGYMGYTIYTTPDPPVVYKTVTAKLMPVEPDPQRNVSRTVYYLVAADGTHVSVDITTWLCTQPGQHVGARGWTQ
jgi:hypothetical protein